MLLCVLGKEHPPGRDWRLRIEDWISLFQHVRQTRTWEPLLQCLCLNKLLLKQQKRKKLYGTKNSYMHVQLGQILDKKIPKTKTFNCHLWKDWCKTGVLGRKAGYCTYPHPSQYHQSHPSGPSPGHTPTLTSYKGQLAPTSQGSEQGNLLFFLHSLAAARDLVKTCWNFLAGL